MLRDLRGTEEFGHVKIEFELRLEQRSRGHDRNERTLIYLRKRTVRAYQISGFRVFHRSYLLTKTARNTFKEQR
jgi:hypothetical protein